MRAVVKFFLEKMVVKIGVFLLVVGLIACEPHTLEIEHPFSEFEEKPVVNSFLKCTNDSLFFNVQLSLTKSICDYTDTASIIGAVSLFNGAEPYELTYDNEQSIDNFIGFKNNKNTIYGLNVLLDNGLSCNSTDTLPSKVVVDTATMNYNLYLESSGPVGAITFLISDPKGEANFYEVEVNHRGGSMRSLSSDDHVITSEFYYPQNIQLEGHNCRSLLFSDLSFNGKQKEISVQFSTWDYGTGSSFIILEGYFELIFRNVSRSYYNYKTTYYDYRFKLRGDILYGSREPKNIFTNIDKGVGIFGAYYQTNYRIPNNEIIIPNE